MAFLSNGVERGRKVATFSPNTLKWMALFRALGKIGAVIVPVNDRYKAAELAYLLKQSDSMMLIVAARLGEAKARDAGRLADDPVRPLCACSLAANAARHGITCASNQFR